MPYDNLKQATVALATAIRDKAEALTFSPTSETVDLLEGAALVKASQQVESIALTVTDSPTVQSWSAPVDWLPIPELTPTDNIFIGIMAVYPGGGSSFAFSASGNFTVEWGDGLVENYNSGSTAQHTYDYDAFDIAGATITTEGFKQAVVKVYPQPGATWTSLDLTKKPSYITATTHNSNFTCISIASNTVNTFHLRAINTSTAAINYPRLAKLDIAISSQVNYSYFAYSIPNLKQVTLKGVNGALSYAFQICASLERAYIDVSSNNLTSAFDGCTALSDVERVSIISSSATVSSMFSNCPALSYCPDVYCSGSLVGSNMFAGSGLVVTPVINSAVSFDATSMFSGCTRLMHARTQTATCSGATNMYNGCRALVRVDPIVLSGFAVDNMFSSCRLVSPPKVVVTAPQSLSYFLAGASMLRSIHSEWLTVTSGSITSYSYMYSGAYCPVLVIDTLYSLNAISNMISGTGITSLVLPDLSAYPSGATVAMSFSSRLSYFRAPNINFTFSVANQNLSAKALNAIFNDLATVTGKTITVTGNYGITEPGYNPTIATAKGWTVTA